MFRNLIAGKKEGLAGILKRKKWCIRAVDLRGGPLPIGCGLTEISALAFSSPSVEVLHFLPFT
jgi:hypothetical protein